MRELDETEITIVSGGCAGNNQSAHYSTIAGMGKGAATGAAAGGTIGAIFGGPAGAAVGAALGAGIGAVGGALSGFGNSSPPGAIS